MKEFKMNKKVQIMLVTLLTFIVGVIVVMVQKRIYTDLNLQVKVNMNKLKSCHLQVWEILIH